MNTMKGAARRVATTAGAADSELQGRVYQNQETLSTRELLERAGDVLCLLSFFPLSETARAGFLALLARRIERAYGEMSR